MYSGKAGNDLDPNDSNKGDDDEDEDIRISIVKKTDVTSHPHRFMEISQFLTLSPLYAGPLLKLSTKGKWQKRWWEIKGPFLMYWQNSNASVKKKNILPLPDAAIDLRVMVEVSLDEKSSILSIVSQRGREFKFKPAHSRDNSMMPKWEEAIQSFIIGDPRQSPSAQGTAVVLAQSVLADDTGADGNRASMKSRENKHTSSFFSPAPPKVPHADLSRTNPGWRGCCFAGCASQN